MTWHDHNKPKHSMTWDTTCLKELPSLHNKYHTAFRTQPPPSAWGPSRESASPATSWSKCRHPPKTAWHHSGHWRWRSLSRPQSGLQSCFQKLGDHAWTVGSSLRGLALWSPQSSNASSPQSTCQSLLWSLQGLTWTSECPPQNYRRSC